MKKIILLCINLINSILCFENLNDIQHYTNKHKEFAEMDNTDWDNPDYTSFYKSLQPSFFQKILQKIGLGTEKKWSTNVFKQLLHEVMQQRINKGITGEIVEKIIFKEPIQLVVWGDLHGALHSLERDLSYLYQEKIIDDALKIIKPDYYFVFNGDSINRSPYTLETFTVLLLLMKRNPERVIWIRGKHEDKDYWKNFALKRELKEKTDNFFYDQTYQLLSPSISTFFNTLPLALYISAIQAPLQLLRISHVGRDDERINEKFMGDFFVDTSPQIQYYNLEKKKKSTKPVDIETIIKTDEWKTRLHAKNGLGLLDQDLGASAWSVLSSPIGVHKQYLNFHYDAFVIINCRYPIAQSSITLINQNINNKTGFKKHMPRNIYTGRLESKKEYQQKEDFIIGSSLALKGGVPAMGKQVKRGMTVEINDVNRKEGGINGHHIATIFYNDDYIPYIARRNILRLLEQDNADVILLPTGSPTLSSYLDYIREDKILVLFPITGGPQFRAPDLVGLINYRATYADEVYALIDYIYTEYAARKFAFFYQDDAYGRGPLKAAHEALKAKGITQWTDIPYSRASINFESQVKKIREVQPDAIGLFSAATPTLEFLRQVGIENLANKQLFGISFLGEESIRRFATQQGLNIVFGAVVPNPWLSQLPIVQEYRKAMDAYNYPYDVFSLEAFIATNILIDALKKIKGPITRNKIKSQLESLNNYNLKGLTLTFDPNRRDLARSVWIETSKDKLWIQKPIHKQEDNKKRVTSINQAP